jgi:hypothetical protein
MSTTKLSGRTKNFTLVISILYVGVGISRGG